jgi:hypothetical protein
MRATHVFAGVVVAIVLAAALGARPAAAEILIATAGPMTGAYAWARRALSAAPGWRSRISTPRAAYLAKESS